MSAPATPEVRLAPGPIIDPPAYTSPAEKIRARRAAWARYEAALAAHDAWARQIALAAARGQEPFEYSVDRLIVARAAEFEASADVDDVVEPWKAVA